MGAFIENARTFKENARTFIENIAMFEENVGTFIENMRTFKENIATFKENARTFIENVAMFKGKRLFFALLKQNEWLGDHALSFSSLQFITTVRPIV
jgi:hypothetical protein